MQTAVVMALAHIITAVGDEVSLTRVKTRDPFQKKTRHGSVGSEGREAELADGLLVCHACVQPAVGLRSRWGK